jgi:hypothetical protein
MFFSVKSFINRSKEYSFSKNNQYNIEACLHNFCTFLPFIMQPGSLISSSPTLYPSPVMSNFFGTLIAILTFALPITLISQNSASTSGKPSGMPTALPESAKTLSPAAIVPAKSLQAPSP